MDVFDPVGKTELDFLIECLRKLVTLDRQAREFTRNHPRGRNVYEDERDAFRVEFNSYFRLQPHMDTWGVFWELLRLADMPAGSLEKLQNA